MTPTPAQILAECMDYPWEYMPEAGREKMRKDALKIAAPLLKEQAARITELEALCLNALYHHQGASSAVGQPIRKALGMGEFDRLTQSQLNIIHNVRAAYVDIAEGKQA